MTVWRRPHKVKDTDRGWRVRKIAGTSIRRSAEAAANFDADQEESSFPRSLGSHKIDSTLASGVPRAEFRPSATGQTSPPTRVNRARPGVDRQNEALSIWGAAGRMP
ncbi:MAG: hypothetical protein GTO26_10725 [Planctomycetales bacterium]|nr:hypothetical protein [Planctomycetales bacterium]NIO35427.1 hypothetical protein [Planctomycetales bacterium]NIP70573.1 hypothetical protein [Planctomycetales bacterium]